MENLFLLSNQGNQPTNQPFPSLPIPFSAPICTSSSGFSFTQLGILFSFNIWIWNFPCSGASLYIRPFLFGSGPELGLSPAKTVTFIIDVNPVRGYYGSGMGKSTLKRNPSPATF